MGWTDEIEDGQVYYETVPVGDEDGGTLRRYVIDLGGAGPWTQTITSEDGSLILSPSTDTGDATVEETQNEDGSVTYKFSGTGSNLQIDMVIPEDFGKDAARLGFYPPEYISSFIYETFAGNAFNEAWSNVQQIPHWSDKWSGYDQNDLLDIAVLLSDALQPSFEFSGGANAVYYRYLSLRKTPAQDLWISYFYALHQWVNEDYYGADAYLAFYAEKDGAYSGFLLNLNRLTAWFYGRLALTQDIIDADSELIDCRLADSGILTVKPWSMYGMTGLEKPPFVEQDKSSAASALAEGDEIEHAMLMVKLRSESRPVLFAGSDYETIYRIDSDSMTITHKIGYGTGVGNDYQIYGFDHGTDGYLYAVGTIYPGITSLLLKLNPDDLSIVYEADLGGPVPLAFPAYNPNDGYLYIAEGSRPGGGSGDVGRIYKVNPSDGGVTDKLEGGFVRDSDGHVYTDICISYLYLGMDGYLYGVTNVDEYQVIKVTPSTMTMADRMGGQQDSFCDAYLDHICLDKYSNIYTGRGSLMFLYKNKTETWQPNTYYTGSDPVVPTSPNGYHYRPIYYNYETAGYSGGIEPIWPTTIGDTVADNELMWECKDPETDYYCEYYHSLKIDNNLALSNYIDHEAEAIQVDLSFASVMGPDGYLYIGSDQQEVGLFKVDPSNMSVIDTYDYSYITFHALVFDSMGFLYGQEYNEIHKINPSDMSQVAVFTPDDNNLNDYGDIISNKNRLKMLESL